MKKPFGPTVTEALVTTLLHVVGILFVFGLLYDGFDRRGWGAAAVMTALIACTWSAFVAWWRNRNPE